MSFTPLDPLPASDLNDLVENIESLADGTGFDAGAIGTADIADAAVTPNKLDLDPATSTVVTAAETTTSTSYADLSTVTDTVTVTVGANGLALVNIYVGLMYNNTATTGYSYASFALSGANTVAAADSKALAVLATGANVPQVGHGASFLLTGLSAGSTTFKMKYRAAAGTAGFANRQISVVPL